MITAKEANAIMTPSDAELKKRALNELEIIEPYIIDAAMNECMYVILCARFWGSDNYEKPTNEYILACKMLSDLGFELKYVSDRASCRYAAETHTIISWKDA